MGGAGPIFTGARRQRGGSVLGAIKSVVSPLLSGVGNSIKKNAMNNAFGLALDVVGDIFTGKNIKSSLINRAKQRVLKTLKDTFSDVRGMPIRRKKKVVKRMKKRVLGKKQMDLVKRTGRLESIHANAAHHVNHLPRRNDVV